MQCPQHSTACLSLDGHHLAACKESIRPAEQALDPGGCRHMQRLHLQASMGCYAFSAGNHVCTGLQPALGAGGSRCLPVQAGAASQAKLWAAGMQRSHEELTCRGHCSRLLPSPSQAAVCGAGRCSSRRACMGPWSSYVIGRIHICWWRQIQRWQHPHPLTCCNNGVTGLTVLVASGCHSHHAVWQHLLQPLLQWRSRCHRADTCDGCDKGFHMRCLVALRGWRSSHLMPHDGGMRH